MKIYFVRHGESEANMLREISNRGLRHGLTERGRQQALALAQNLRGVSLDRIYTSPLLRAEILSRESGVPYEVRDALREYDCGVMEGSSDEQAWLAHRQIREAWIARREFDQRIEGGESLLDIRTRFEPFIENLVQAFGETDETLVLVGHGGTYQVMLPLLLTNLSLDAIPDRPLVNTGYALAEMRPAGFVCLEWFGLAIAPGS